ncbi:hypothetical protein [Deinococcus petrolearius]|uniref:Uncharacterized protein n=1 Tax=Deinococcus petrolearius TaxID=1751295 RepID=A0ABW1DM67_9DEIO
MQHYDLTLHLPAQGPPLHAEALRAGDHFQACTRGLLVLRPGSTFVAHGRGEWDGETLCSSGVLRGPGGGEQPATVTVTRRTLAANTRNESLYRAHYSSQPVLQVDGHGPMVPRDAHALARSLRCALAIHYTGGSP